MLCKSYLTLISSSSSHLYTHDCHCYSIEFFKFLLQTTCWLLISSLKSLLVTFLCSKSSRIAADFVLNQTHFAELDCVAVLGPISSEFARVLTGFVTLWLWSVYFDWLVAVLVDWFWNPCFLDSNFRVCGEILGIFEVSGV